MGAVFSKWCGKSVQPDELEGDITDIKDVIDSALELAEDVVKELASPR